MTVSHMVRVASLLVLVVGSLPAQGTTQTPATGGTWIEQRCSTARPSKRQASPIKASIPRAAGLNATPLAH